MAYELDIDSIFSFHPPANEDTAKLHDLVRFTVREVAKEWNRILPASAEKTLAIRKLQEAMMFANSAVGQYSDKSE